MCPVKEFATASPVMAFQTQIVLSSEPKTTHRPFDEISTELTEPLCPVNGPATISPIVVFHTQIVPLLKPETICWPSGETAMETTELTTFEITISDDGQSDNCPCSTRRVLRFFLPFFLPNYTQIRRTAFFPLSPILS